MPADFPAAPYEAVLEAVRQTREAAPAPWGEFAVAWVSLSHRFVMVAEHDEAFATSVRRDGLGPPPPVRHRQDENLFSFFVAGISTLETFAYGTWAMVWAAGDTDFALATPGKQRQVNLRSLRARLDRRNAQAPLTLALGRVIDSNEYSAWADVRNALTHRATPGRHHTVSTGDHDPEPMPWGAIHLDEQTTTLRRAWLATTLSELLSAAEVFASEHLPP
jgi:hypothetical protein